MPRTSSRISSGDPDTIVALSTPAGPGLRAVVRLSGPRALELGASLPGAVSFRAPRTYTREDLVEIHLPSSPPLVERLIRSLIERGARLARAGEFTLRAFLSGRIDLAQAEAVEQLVDSESQEDRQAAALHLRGGFSRELGRLEGEALDLCAEAEAAIDFVDEDIELLPAREAVLRAGQVLGKLRRLMADTSLQRVARERPTVALFGLPNAGKSSLFNALTGGRVLVSDLPGTTRDVLSGELDLGFPVRLLDAAGQGATGGLEGEAALRGRQALSVADLVLFVVDVTRPETAAALAPPAERTLLVLNKCDLASPLPVRPRFRIREAVFTSATTGQGLDELRRRVAERLETGANLSAGRFRVNQRQLGLLREAELALERSAGAGPELGLEFVALDLRAALAALGGLSGREVGEDLLDRIFSKFCLGK
jgi:tRNA modification GTPase